MCVPNNYTSLPRTLVGIDITGLKFAYTLDLVRSLCTAHFTPVGSVLDWR